MANWYDNGLKGKDNNLIASDSLTNPSGRTDSVLNLEGYSSCGSIALYDSSETYDKLLMTNEKGTQIYVEIKSSLGNNRTFYNPEEVLGVREYTARIYLKNGTSKLYTDTGYHVIGSTIAGENSVYDYNYRSGQTYADSYGRIATNRAFPRGKAGAANNMEIGCVSTNRGIEFYVVGFAHTSTWTYEGNYVYFSAPAIYMGYIPSSALNNPFWFDSTSDGLTKSEKSGGIGGRTVDGNYNGKDIDFPSLPTGANALGFSAMKMYKPSAVQLGQALDILWSDSSESTLETIIESAKKWWYKPEQYCTSVMLTPVNVSTSSSSSITFGKYDSEVVAPVVSEQWQIVDCGTLSIPLMYGSYLDFTMVKAMIYLPYIGFRSINVQEIMGGTLAIKYYVDIFTGSAVCFIRISNENCNNSILYSYDCNVNTQVPITSNNYNNVITNMQRAVINTAGAIGSGISGNAYGVANYGQAAAQSGMEAIKGIMTPDVQTSGSLTPNTGVLGHNKPYVVLHFPVSLEDGDFTTINGKVSANSVNVGSLHGYNAFREIHLDGIDLPANVLQEVENQFKAGVII